MTETPSHEQTAERASAPQLATLRWSDPPRWLAAGLRDFLSEQLPAYARPLRVRGAERDVRARHHGRGPPADGGWARRGRIGGGPAL